MTNQPNSKVQNDETSWEGCPPGMLVSMAEDLSTNQRRKQTLRSVAFSSVVLLACGALVARSFSVDHKVGGILCSECKPHFAAYSLHLEGKTSEGETLKSELIEQMKLHLAGCKRCRGKFLETYPGLLADRTFESRLPNVVYSIALQTSTFGSSQFAGTAHRRY